MDIADMKVVTYDQISEEYRARGVDLRDLEGHGGHYDLWLKANGLAREADPKASQAQFQRYVEDPAGEAASPPYIDFWHELLHATERFPWVEHAGHREKTVPLSPVIWADVPDPDDEQLSSMRRRLEDNAGAPLPDEMWEGVRRDIMLRRPRAARAREIAAEIVERHGFEHPAAGRIAMITLRVAC